ncbi:MAG: RNA polymerase sigma factor [Candidatus Muiribacteriota bacterium]
MSQQFFEEIYDEYFDKIYFYVLSITCDKDEAKDISQETFVKIYTILDKIEKIENLKAYIYRIARNLSMDRFRIIKKVTGFLNRVTFEDVIYREEESNDEYFSLMESMKKIKKEYRNILHLRYYENLSYEEIAEYEKISIGTVMSRLNRAKKALKEVIL